MPDVKLKTRIQNKYKTLNEWNEIAAGEFIPLKGEVCYAIDGNILYQKVGDGVTDFTELDWLISPSTQSDNSENDETSFAYIKNRLAYDMPIPVPEDKQLIKDMTKIHTITYSKETLHQAIPDLAALLPTHIDNYLIEQLHMDDGDGVSNFDLFRAALNSFVVDVNNIFTSEELLISEDQNFILMTAGNPVFINIWITLSDTDYLSSSMYPMDYNLDKDYCVFFALSKAENSFYGTFIGDLNVYNADAYSLQLKHTIENSVVPIDDRFLINSKSNWDEMDSSKVSYIYNKYGNIATAQLDNEMLDSYKTTILGGSFEIGSKYADGYQLKNCSFGIQNWQSQYVGLPFKDFKVRITYQNGKTSITYQNCAFFYGQDYLCKGNSNPLVFIGNPSFLSKAYYAYSLAFEDLVIADQEDNGLPFLFGFDLSLDQPLVKCFLEGELISDTVDYHIEISTSTIALATKMVPDYLIMKEKEPWIYNETKESVMSPTAYEASGIGSVAIGSGTKATKQQSFATGVSTNANGVASFTQGSYTKASKIRSAALGYKTWSNGANALTIGDNTYATGSSAFAGGQESTAAGMGSVAFAQGSYVSGKNSVAFGYGLLDDVSDSIEGAVRPSATTIEIPAADYDYDWCSLWSYCFVSGATTDTIDVAIIKKIAQSGDIITLTLDREIDVAYTDFEFYQATRVEGDNSFSMGSGNLVEGDSTIALGDGLVSTSGYQTVIGQYNVDDDKAFIIGQGDAYDNRKNIFSVDREGNVEATNFIANYINDNGEKSTVSLSEISNLTTRIESLENEEPYIPQKGVDYFTESDKQEIVNNIIEYFGGSPILGYIDENNNIIITSDLENGTYIFKYEESNGAYANIGNLTIGDIISYSITNSLIGCSADINNTNIINENETIILKYIADEGFVFDTTISVNGASYTWDAITGILVLSNPTENVTVVITATKDGYTNIIDTVGYTDGYRL